MNDGELELFKCIVAIVVVSFLVCLLFGILGLNW